MMPGANLDQAQASPSSRNANIRVPLIALLIGLMIVLWIPVAYLVEPMRFAVLSPVAHVGLEAASSLSRLFAALVLLLLPKTIYGRSVRWISCGLVVLAVGGVFFGSLPYATNYELVPRETVMGSLATSTIAGTLFVVGLFPKSPPRLTWWVVFGSIGSVLLVKLITFTSLDVLFNFWSTNVEITDSSSFAILLSEATIWYWILMPAPIVLSIVVVAGAGFRYAEERLPAWLLFALIFWSGAQIHNLWWPTTYSLTVTTTDIFRFAFALSIVIAGVFALRDSTREFARLLEAERLANEQLARSNKLRDDFTSMVSHELGSPVSAIRRYAEVIETDDSTDAQRHALRAIRAQTEALRTLVRDIQTIASIEADTFSVNVQSVSVEELIDEAQIYAVTVEGEHPFIVNREFDGNVMADSIRIGQVLRNLIDNAAKYSPSGARIHLNISKNGSRIIFAIKDEGSGIEADSLERIFQKNTRGGHRSPDLHRAGAGLGLYLSQRIVQAHGSEIRAISPPGEGSTFLFSLKESS